MGGADPHEIALNEAREKLREAAGRATVTGWVRSEPLEAFLTVFLVGLRAGGGGGALDASRELASLVKRLIKG